MADGNLTISTDQLIASLYRKQSSASDTMTVKGSKNLSSHNPIVDFHHQNICLPITIYDVKKNLDDFKQSIELFSRLKLHKCLQQRLLFLMDKTLFS